MTADDLEGLVDHMMTTLIERLGADWLVPAGELTYSCWELIEHLAESLFFYAGQLVAVPEAIVGSYPYVERNDRPGGHEGTLFVDRDEGPAGLLRALNACSRIVVSLLRTAPSAHRARHMWGHADPEGFAAMSVVEIAVHVHDLASTIGIDWNPSPQLCALTLARLFPDVEVGNDPWATLLWATGRTALADRPRLDDWRWYSEPR